MNGYVMTYCTRWWSHKVHNTLNIYCLYQFILRIQTQQDKNKYSKSEHPTKLKPLGSSLRTAFLWLDCSDHRLKDDNEVFTWFSNQAHTLDWDWVESSRSKTVERASGLTVLYLIFMINLYGWYHVLYVGKSSCDLSRAFPKGILW